MTILERALANLAKLQKKFALPLVIFLLIITIIVGSGITEVGVEGDMNKEFPQDLPIFKLNDKISNKLGGQDSTLILLSLNNSHLSEATPRDIRNGEVLRYLINLENLLLQESSFDEVTSASTYLKKHSDKSNAYLETVAKNSPQLNSFFSDDYTKTIMFVTSDVGSGGDKVRALTDLINDKIESLGQPAGISTVVTGTPQLQVTIVDILKEDAMFTIALGSFLILILLFVIRRSLLKSLLIFIPLSVGLVWTLGTMGWLGIKLSIATVGIGAMILGLGVEYGVFMLERYEEERNNKSNQKKALQVAVSSVGSAILGSGLTTMSGFLALTVSILPLLQKLGFTLALGIFFCLISAIVVMPPVIILEEKFLHWQTLRTEKRIARQKQTLREL